MKAFLVTAGVVFGLVVIAHIARITVEPQIATDPWFWATTVVAGALSLWACWLVWRFPRS